MTTTQRILLALIILCLALLLFTALAGCTISVVNSDSRTFIDGNGNSYNRETHIQADDGDTADVQTDAELGLPLPL